ncbi:MAG: hypothetical protein FWE53_04230 [Firmicutes bacterium]|nr:hypothetical protein [Bacillota bacterium]
MKKLEPKLYDAMFTRKSTRAFSGAEVSEKTLEKIREFLANVVPINNTVRYSFDIQNLKDGTYKVNAFYDDTLLGNVNVGFCLQQLDLYLQTLDLGSLWLGMSMKPKNSEEFLPLKYSICLVFGIAKGSPKRVVTEFERKPIDKTIDSPEMFEVFEPVRLAPSACNGQPWFFVAENNTTVHAYCVEHGFVKKRLFGKMNQVDMGITLCHAALALQHTGMEFDIHILGNAPKKEGHYYIATLKLI